MAISLMGIFLIFADVFDSIGVPTLVEARQKSEDEFLRYVKLFFTFTTILAFLLTGLALLTVPLLLKVPFGFQETALKYTKISYYLLLPYLFFSFFFHHLGAVFRSQRYFTVYFLGEFIFSLLSFLFIILGLFTLKEYWVIPLSLSSAQALTTLFMLYLGKDYIGFSFFYEKRIRLIFKHFLYLCSLYGVFHLFAVVDRAFGSVLGEKNISALFYGLMISHAPRGIIKFEHLAITSLSEAKGSFKKLNFYLKKLLILGIVFSLLILIFAEFLVKLFFYYGAFSKTDLNLTIMATKYYALCLPLSFLWPMIYRTFQIINILKPVFFIAIAGVLGNALFNYLFVMIFSLGLIGICLGTFMAFLILCSLSYFFLAKILVNFKQENFQKEG